MGGLGPAGHADVQAQNGVTPRALVWPRDHGAHPDTRTEWWYATGWLQDTETGVEAPAYGFQLTFFRSRTGLAAKLESRFAARQLLFAHAALTDLAARSLRHAERLARWSGDQSAKRAAASLNDTRVHIGDWRLERAGDAYQARIGDEGAGFALRLVLAPTQPLLLQGDAGFSRKGPAPQDASHYYSQTQLNVSGELMQAGKSRAVRGRAWLDHEWSESVLPDGAVGWDWIGINFADGGALTAFRLRRADGSAVWAGGSHRPRSGTAQVFAPNELRFEPLAHWTSAATRARYPVRWRVHTPAGAFEVRALLDAQELDNRASTGTVYWEGLSELLDATGSRVGLGYLEMTGYAAPLRL
ncbi:MAG: carotenoid 1,2-hydratase [Pseudomonadota bacterium]